MVCKKWQVLSFLSHMPKRLSEVVSGKSWLLWNMMYAVFVYSCPLCEIL